MTLMTLIFGIEEGNAGIEWPLEDNDYIGPEKSPTEK